jgi:hypothetical protein
MRQCVALSRAPSSCATACPGSGTFTATHEPAIRRFVVALEDATSVRRSHGSRLGQCVIISYSRVGTEWPHVSGDMGQFLSVTGHESCKQSYIPIWGTVRLRQRVQTDSRVTEAYQMRNVNVNYPCT